MTLKEIDWPKLGQALRESAMDTHDGELPSVDIAYSFLLDNPECFADLESDDDEWPENMPTEPPFDLISAYYYGQ